MAPEHTEIDRSKFLKKLFEVTKGDRTRRIADWDSGREIGFDQQYTVKIIDYLVGEGQIERTGLNGIISITHKGIKEAESESMS